MNRFRRFPIGRLARALLAALALGAIGCGGSGHGGSASGGGGGGGGAFPNFFPSDTRVDTAASPAQGRIACGGANVYAAWLDGAAVMFRRSTDGGVTWQPAVAVDGGGVDSVDQLALCADGTRVYVAWAASGAGILPNGNEIEVNASSDGGATWLVAPKRADASVVFVRALETCCSGADFYVVWNDKQSGVEDTIYANHSSDGGATFAAADSKLDLTGGAADVDTTDDLSVCCEGSQVHVAWVADTTTGSKPDYVAVQSSLDGGTTWLAAPANLSGTPVDTLGDPRICCSGGHVHSVWTAADGSVQTASSFDGGVTFASRTTIDAPGGGKQVYDPEIAASGQDVVIVYNDDRSSGPDLLIDARAVHSSNGGVSWNAPSVPVNTTGHSSAGGNFLLRFDGDTVLATWWDFRNDSTAPYDLDLRLNYSTDRGATWSARDVQVNTTGHVNSSMMFSLCADAGHVYVGWPTVGGSGFRMNASNP